MGLDGTDPLESLRARWAEGATPALQMVCGSRGTLLRRGAPRRPLLCIPASATCWSEKRASHSVGVRECDARAFRCALWPVGTFCWTQALRRHAVTAVKVGLAEQCLSCRTSSGQAAELIRMLGQPAAASACSAALPGLRSASAVGERRRPLVRISTFCNRQRAMYSCNEPQKARNTDMNTEN